MSAVGAERDVVVGGAGDVEPERIGEHGVVTVGARVEHQHPVALADLLSADLDVARGGAVHVAHRRRPAQHLLDRTRQQLGLRSQTGELVGVLQQRGDASRDDVAGGLVAAHQDEHRLEHQVDVAEWLVTIGRVHHQADQIGTRSATALVDLGRDVLPPVAHRLFDLGTDLVAAGGEQVAPVEEGVMVALGQAHQLADQVHRQRGGDVGDHVALAPFDHPVDQLGDLGAEVRLVVLDATAGESGADQAASPCVLGCVEVDHRRHRALGPGALARAEGTPVAADSGDVGMRCEAPDADGVVPVDGRFGPHPGGELVEVGVEVG